MKAVNKQIDPLSAFVEVIVSGDIATAIRLLRRTSQESALLVAQPDKQQKRIFSIGSSTTSPRVIPHCMWVRRRNKLAL